MLQALLALFAFACLIQTFAVTDLSVKLVAMNSHPDKPFLYKIAGTWGNHEGSMLLWVAVMALAGGGVAALERRIGDQMRSEEHTSELQSLMRHSYAVFCWKKKK